MDRKTEIKKQIEALREELGVLCITEKARTQREETVYHMLISPELILLRFTPGNIPSTQGYQPGLTRIMRHYGLRKKDVHAIEEGYGPDIAMYASAYLGEINPKTNDRWMGSFDLWDWLPDGPTLFQKRVKS